MSHRFSEKHRYTVGLILLGLCAALFFLALFRQEGLHRNGNTYQLIAADAGELRVGAEVRINGLRSGSVRDVSLKDRQAAIRISLKPGIVLHQNAIARLSPSTFLGGRMVVIYDKHPESPALKYGEQIIVLPSAPDPPELVERFGKMSLSFIKLAELGIMLGENAPTLPETMKRKDALVGRLHKTGSRLQSLSRLAERSLLLAEKLDLALSYQDNSLASRLEVLLKKMEKITLVSNSGKMDSMQKLEKLARTMQAMARVAKRHEALLIDLEKVTDGLMIYDELFIRRLMQQEGVLGKTGRP